RRRRWRNEDGDGEGAPFSKRWRRNPCLIRRAATFAWRNVAENGENCRAIEKEKRTERADHAFDRQSFVRAKRLRFSLSVSRGVRGSISKRTRKPRGPTSTSGWQTKRATRSAT